MPRAAGAREPAERGGEEVTVGAQRRQVVGGRLVRRRVLVGPVVRLGGFLQAAQLALLAGARERLAAGVQVDRVLVVELRHRVRPGLPHPWRWRQAAASSASSHTKTRYSCGSSPGSTTVIRLLPARRNRSAMRRPKSARMLFAVGVGGLSVVAHGVFSSVVICAAFGVGCTRNPVVQGWCDPFESPGLCPPGGAGRRRCVAVGCVLTRRRSRAAGGARTSRPGPVPYPTRPAALGPCSRIGQHPRRRTGRTTGAAWTRTAPVPVWILHG